MKHRRNFNKFPAGGSKLPEYSVETPKSKKLRNEGKFSSIPTMASLLTTFLGHDFTCIPQFINKNMGAPLMASHQSSGIVYDRGRHLNLARRTKRSDLLRSKSALSYRIVMPKSEFKSTIIHIGGTLQTPEVNDPQALTATRLKQLIGLGNMVAQVLDDDNEELVNGLSLRHLHFVLSHLVAIIQPSTACG